MIRSTVPRVAPRNGTAGGSGGSSPRVGTAGGSGESSPRVGTAWGSSTVAGVRCGCANRHASSLRERPCHAVPPGVRGPLEASAGAARAAGD